MEGTLTCAACGIENRADRRFCRQCGTPLAVACRVCGAANEPDDRFCGVCGAALGEGGLTGAGDPAASERKGRSPINPAPTTERRLVSVLFVDLVDFTAAAEAADPEAVQSVQRRYFDQASEVVARYGGAIEKYIGDAVMAVWGAPVAHEDDAERAVRAALDVVDAVSRIDPVGWEHQLKARAAVMTGEAAATIGATGHGMVTGDLVNTAARLQGAGDPGWVLVDDATRQATIAAIAFEPVGDRSLKGKREAVTAWRATSVLAGRGGAGRSEALEPPFVGRSDELHLLKELLHATDRESKARLVSIIGVAGIGKSRLAWELEKHVDGISEEIYWHQGRSPAYGEGVAFWALGEMVRRRAGIAETDEPAVARERLQEAVDGYVPDVEERLWIGPRLAALLGLEEAPTTERSDLFAAWRTFFERVALRGTTVMVFEDLQWADQGLLDFIESLVEWSRVHPILVVTLARPELLERRSDWGRGARSFTSLHLDRLDDAAMRELLTGVVVDMPAALTDQVIARSEGIPLYAVETIRMLIGEGRLVAGPDGTFRTVGDAGPLRIPDTLRGLIAARLDGLDPADRGLVQDASVLGLSFTSEAVAAVASLDPASALPRLGGLVRREIFALDVDPRSPERGQYVFVQGLLREVAYGTLAKADRRSRHLAAVRYFEATGGDEITAIVADHYLQAHAATSPGPEADALAAQARRALRAAGDRAAALHSSLDAVRYYEQALALTTDLAEVAELHERAGDAARAGVRRADAEAHLAAAVSAYRALSDRSGVARGTAALARVMNNDFDVDGARRVLDEGLAEVDDLGDDPGLAAFLAELARCHMFVADNELGIPTVDRALGMAERLELIPVIADAMITKGNLLENLGRLREAIALQRGAAALAQANGLTSIHVRALNNLTGRLYAEDPRESWAAVTECLDVARRAGEADWQLGAVAWFTAFAIPLGRWDEALAMMDEIGEKDLPLAVRVSFGSTRINVLAYRGQAGAAEALSEEIAPMRASLTRAEDAAQPHLERSVMELCRGDYELAVAAAFEGATQGEVTRFFRGIVAAPAAVAAADRAGLQRALGMVEDSPERGRYTGAMRQYVRGALALAEGDVDTGLHELRDATRYMRLCEGRLDLIFALLAIVRLAPPEHPFRSEAAIEARSIIDELGASALGDLLEASLLAGSATAPPTAGRPTHVTQTIATQPAG